MNQNPQGEKSGPTEFWMTLQNVVCFPGMHSFITSFLHQSEHESNIHTTRRASTYPCHLVFGTFTACHLLLHTCRPVFWSGVPIHWGSHSPGLRCSTSSERRGFLSQSHHLHSQTPVGSHRGALSGRCQLPSGSERGAEITYSHFIELLFFIYYRVKSGNI